MNNEIKTVSPFKNFCMTIGNLPTSYLESMSYYETLCWLIKYLENTIKPAVNQNAEALKELQYYVEHLDLTDEVNTRLDEMAEDGTLAHIINVEMIGNLSNLDTTNKENLVSAINEVNTNLIDINLSEYTTYNTTIGNLNLSVGTVIEGALYTAKNSSGSLGKVYGHLYISLPGGTQLATNKITIQTEFRPTNDFTVSALGIRYVYYDEGNPQLYETFVNIKSTGEVEIPIPTESNSTNVRVQIFPCLLYIKDFGDIGN